MSTLAVLFAALALSASAPAAPQAGTAACEVFLREASFARSVDNHDADAFAAHLHPGAVFGVGTPAVLHGREAILAGWRGIVEGKPTTLRWRPQFAHLGSEPDLATSHGPYLLTRTDPDGTLVQASGRFFSVWKRQPDGQWYVLFDGGEPARPIEAAQASSLFDGLATECVEPQAAQAHGEMPGQ
jgi:ketosteroid isomerase-like protein